MPYGLTAKQEAFCKNVVSGMKLVDAYIQAYNTKNVARQSINVRASGLMRNAKVLDRLKELRAPALAAEHITAESHVAELRRLRDLALDAGKHEAAIRAEELRGKVAGLYITKVESGAPGAFQALDAQAKITAIEAIKAELDRRAALTHDTNVTDVEPK